MTSHTVALEGISVSFLQQRHFFHKEQQSVIHNLSLTFIGGEIVALVGESGCGKSVLSRSIMGILPENALFSGDIMVNGEKVRDPFLFGKEHFIYLPQSVNCLNPLLKMKQQIPLGQTELAQKMPELYPFQCSGGMLKQGIFSVIQEKPEAFALIADEPTIGMDTETALENLQFLRQCAKKGMAVLCITHDFDLALEVADKIAVFYEKSVIEVVKVEDFHPNSEGLIHPYTRALYEALPQHGFGNFQKDKGGER